ncbi:MAG: hypothetical protein ACTSWN_05085 [Promethearchaeota archaeon]
MPDKTFPEKISPRMKKKFDDAVKAAKEFKQEFQEDTARREEILNTPMEF